MSTDDLQVLSALVGVPVVAAERCAWGFENRTDALTLADGRRLVLQRIANRALAPHKLRLADPLFDAAWWGWVVRYHHPGRWAVAWPALLDAAGIAEDAPTAKRIQALLRLRCLELLDQASGANPARAAIWAARLVETLQW